MNYQYYNPNIKQTIYKKASIKLAKKRANPSLHNADFLLLRARLAIIKKFVNSIDSNDLMILDIGGRIQPYRFLFEERYKKYLGLDPQLQGQTDIIGFGETIPFKDEIFDVVISTQVLSYVNNPFIFIEEIFRCLKQGGVLLLSAPSFFPEHHDEHWRFLPEGFKLLLQDFSDVKIEPEGNSLTGIIRTLCVVGTLSFNNKLMKKLFKKIIIPSLNLLGNLFLKSSLGSNHFVANYSIYAKKPEN